MEYKGYLAAVTFDEQANIFHGEVYNTRDINTFQGICVEDLHREFINSVEDYLEFCAERGEKPDKPLRLTPELHQQVFLQAKKAGVRLNPALVIGNHQAGFDRTTHAIINRTFILFGSWGLTMHISFNGAQPDGQDIDEQVGFRLLHARVGQDAEMNSDARRPGGLPLRTRQLPSSAILLHAD